MTPRAHADGIVQIQLLLKPSASSETLLVQVSAQLRSSQNITQRKCGLLSWLSHGVRVVL